ncbi:PREDICTED: uncharacterized protein LOC108558522 [Nicrophorus vespilloides]|uniref:Uncharacterized protein LOC108558522 n=1 Tax=Nicrophorus vespilloides TaxID=110193 RepID=A0ABM1M8P1_NICVS|nr:PREDICTED: uncharacterized protein LOC108558522 [Nicrophorus vespilloides]
MADFDEFVAEVESHLQRLLEEHNYNTVGNFVALYDSFRKSSCTSFTEFYQNYAPPITPSHHTCVGLALELWLKLKHLSSHLYLVSCEESIGVFDEYAGLYDSIYESISVLEKEHVLLAVKVDVCGRAGILLCDPGYHIGRVVVVMPDELHPHTGWFVQSQEQNVRKEYNYVFSSRNPNFIEWYDRTTRSASSKVEEVHSLIYIKKPFLTAVDVTERRNLVYSFRSLLSRDQKGHLLAGLYFKLKENSDEFTIFYHDDGKQRIKLNFATFTNADRINEQLLNIVNLCNDQLNLKRGELMQLIKRLGDIMQDKAYVRQVLDTNTCINNMTEVN